MPEPLWFLEQLGSETLETFTTEDYLILDAIHREEPWSENFKPRLTRLRDLGIIETHGRGKWMRHILSRRFYGFVGQPGTYTNRLGLDREMNKALLLKHIESNARSGCQLNELTQVLPALAPKAVQRLLSELKDEQRIHLIGRTRNARWYPGPPIET
jgi:ATP-dependent DNA helicase RecG